MLHIRQRILIVAMFLMGAQVALAQAVAPAATPDTTSWRLILAAIGALVLKFIMDGLSHLTNPRDEMKKYIPLVLGAVSLAITLLDRYLASSNWGDATVLGATGVGAIVVNELGNALKKKLSKPDVVAVTSPALTPVPEVKP